MKPARKQIVDQVAAVAMVAIGAAVVGVAGGSIGLGLTTAIFTASSQAKVHSADIANVLNTAQEHAVNGILAGTDSAQDVMEQFPHSVRVLTALSRQAFASGFQSAFRVATALAAFGFIVAVGFIGGRLRLHTEPVAPEVPARAT